MERKYKQMYLDGSGASIGSCMKNLPAPVWRGFIGKALWLHKLHMSFCFVLLFFLILKLFFDMLIYQIQYYVCWLNSGYCCTIHFVPAINKSVISLSVRFYLLTY